MDALTETLVEDGYGLYMLWAAAIGGLYASYRKWRKKLADKQRKPLATIVPPAAIALLLSGCGLFGSAEPTVRALTPVLVQVAEHVANKGLELAELPAQCEWEQDVDDPDKLLVLCTVDTGQR